jgi:hypothetical protein
MSNILKKCVVAVTAILVLAGANSASAVTDAQYQALLDQIETLTAIIQSLGGTVPEDTGSTGTAITGCSISSFDRALKVGMSGDDVECLQIVLNSDDDTQIASSGVGSSGNETEYFGSLTKAAVIKFQEKYAEAVLSPYGLTEGTGYVGSTTRDKLNDLLMADEPTDDDTGDDDTGDTGDDDTGDDYTGDGLSVSLSDDNPAGDNIPTAAQSVEFLRFDLSAGSDDVEIDSIVFTRTGIGSKDDFDKVWLEDEDGNMVSDGKTVNSSDKLTLSPELEIESGETKTYKLVADLSASSGNIDAFEISSASDIDADEDVEGSFPIEGNEMEMSSYTVATVAFALTGSNSNIDVGGDQVIIGEFTINPSSSNNNDSTFESIRLKETGSASFSDFDNIKLYDNTGSVISDDPMIDDNYLIFADLDFDIDDGDTERFSIRADVESGDDGDEMILELKNAYELFVREGNFNFGGSVSGQTNLKTYTLNAGKLGVSLDDSSPNNEEYAPGTSQVTGVIAKVSLDQDVEVDGLKVYLDSTSKIDTATSTLDTNIINADIEDVRLYVDGEYIDQVDDVTGPTTSDDDESVEAGTYYYDFTSSFTLSDDDLIEVRYDIESGAEAGNYYVLEFDHDDFTSPEYVDSGETVADGDLTGSVTSKRVTITSGRITATRNDGYPASHVFIAGTNDAKVFQFVLEAGVASAIEVSKMDFDIDGVDSDDAYYTNAELYAGTDNTGTQLGDTTDFDSTYARFESLDYTISAGDTQTFSLYTDIDTSASDTAITFGLDSSDSLFYDEEGSEVSLDSGSNTTSTTINVDSEGTLTVSVNDEPTGDVITPGSEQTLGSWTFISEDDEIDLTDLYFANDYTGDGNADTGSDSNIQELRVYVDGEQVGSGKPFTSGTVHFDFSADPIVVAKDSTEDVELRAILNEITNESQTNARVRPVLYSITGVGSGGSNLASVTGLDDTKLDGGTYADYGSTNSKEASEFVMTAARPVLTTNASSADTQLINGEADVYAFDVYAQGGPVSLNYVTLTVTGTASGSDISSDITSNVGSGKIYRGTTEKTATVTETGGTVTIEFDSVQTIQEGQTATFVYKATLSGFDVDSSTSDYLSTKIVDSGDGYVAADSASGLSSAFEWSDNTGTYESRTDDQWMNDYLLNELDTELDIVRLSP